MTLVDATIHIPASVRPLEATKTQPRWGTMEFKLYYVVAFVAIPMMIWIPVTLSQATHPNYPYYASRLSNGWLFDRKIDNSDAQYRSFRNNLIPLTSAAFAYLTVKYIWRRFLAPQSSNALHLIPLNLICSLVLIFALHGTSLIKILCILSVNYSLAKSYGGTKAGPVLIWAFNIVILFLTDMYHGYRFGNIFPPLAPLDSFQGILPRWHISFNITMLRLVSFGMDYHWARETTEPSDAKQPTLHAMTEKGRQSTSHPDDMYSFINYLSYVLYTPLFIAGPIMSFNDYLWQLRKPTSITSRSIVSYAFRFLICLLTMEFILHFMYVVAIKDRKAWEGDTAAEISLIGFWNLIIVWQKLLLPWRFFRLWALLDGIDAPENMVRCVVDNYSPMAFWRSWHRSYNLWVIRYIYVPLGGAKRTLLNSLLVFTFVALWHDLTFRLLAWGWLISLFLIPELLSRSLLPAARFANRSWYRHVCALGGVGNLVMMVTANLVGFVLGTEGAQFFLWKIFGSVEGLPFLLAAIIVIFVGVQLMFEYREEEMRKGIFRRC